MAIFKRQGVFWIDYYFQGQRKREKVGSSKRLAIEVLNKRKAQISESKYFPERQRQNISFHDFLGQYWKRHWQYLKGNGGSYLRDDLDRTFGCRNLNSITVADMQDFYNATKTETSIATANRYLARVNHIFERAKKWKQFFGENPAKDIEREKEEGGRDRFLSLDEIGSLLGAVDRRIYPVILCAIHTGMRRGEMLGLLWENVSIEHNTIYVVKSKSGKSREIPVSPQLREVLLSLNPQKSGLVFDIPIITLRRWFDKAVKAAKVGPLRFHDLRHTFASHYVMRTSDLPALQNMLGHYSLKMTQRYAHLAKSHLASGIQIFASSMPPIAVKMVADGHPGRHLENFDSFVIAEKH